VLVADDEPVSRLLVRRTLEAQHYEVLETENGREAVKVAVRERPDLLLIDLNMPEIDGYELIARLRRDVTLASVPVLVLTGDGRADVVRRVLELGAEGFIVKPFAPDLLLSRVEAAFRQRGL
jgi:DNA-binding response OmpR family regulator